MAKPLYTWHKISAKLINPTRVLFKDETEFLGSSVDVTFTRDGCLVTVLEPSPLGCFVLCVPRDASKIIIKPLS